MNDDRTLAQIAQAHPVPWRHHVTPSARGSVQAQVRVIDAAGQEVPLFTLLRVIDLVTHSLAKKATA
jgi:hypothetical protein